jgi:hypothetical protein
VSRLFKMRELTLEILFRDALGKSPDTITPAFTENFRKGKISTSNAALIYRYLRENFQDSIPALDAAVMTAKKFQDFLLRYRRLGDLRILPEIIEPPFRVTRLGPEWHEYPFEASEPVCFELRLPHIYPAAIAIVGGAHGWFPVELEDPTGYQFGTEAPPSLSLRGDRFIKAVTQGSQTICTAPPTLSEQRRRKGTNIFVFLIGDFFILDPLTAHWDIEKPISLTELDALAERFMAEKATGWIITQINASGIGPWEDD